MTIAADRPAAIALAFAVTLALWTPTLAAGGTAKAATIPEVAVVHMVVASPSSIVLM